MTVEMAVAMMPTESEMREPYTTAAEDVATGDIGAEGMLERGREERVLRHVGRARIERVAEQLLRPEVGRERYDRYEKDPYHSDDGKLVLAQALPGITPQVREEPPETWAVATGAGAAA